MATLLPNLNLFLVTLLLAENNRWPYYNIIFSVWVVAHVFVYQISALDPLPYFHQIWYEHYSTDVNPTLCALIISRIK